MVGYVTPKIQYERPGLGEVDEADPFKAADLFLTGQVADVLQRHYPGHAWLIEVSHAQGVVMLSIPLFMGRNKFVLHMTNLKSDPGLRRVVRAGGEILERYRIPRQRFGLDHFLTALDAVPIHKRAHHGVLAN